MPLILIDCTCLSKSIRVKTIIFETDSDLSNNIKQNDLGLAIEKTVRENSHYIYSPKSYGNDLTITMMVSNNSSVLLKASLTNNSEVLYSSFTEFAVNSNDDLSIDAIKAALRKLLDDIHALKQEQKLDNEAYLHDINAYIAGSNIKENKVINAISMLGQSLDKRAFTPIIKILTTTNNWAIGNACMMALGQFKDPEGMQAIIDYTERKPPLVRRQGIAAARMIGSKLALEWLLVLAYGHDDPMVRKEALEATLALEKEHQH